MSLENNEEGIQGASTTYIKAKTQSAAMVLETPGIGFHIIPIVICRMLGIEWLTSHRGRAGGAAEIPTEEALPIERSKYSERCLRNIFPEGNGLQADAFWCYCAESLFRFV